MTENQLYHKACRLAYERYGPQFAAWVTRATVDGDEGICNIGYHNANGRVRVAFGLDWGHAIADFERITA